ncbi:Adenylate cyclase [Geitlerinema sp. FC II]|nr:Adenylate cyclase [Geitlerinema sp. FC II]
MNASYRIVLNIFQGDFESGFNVSIATPYRSRAGTLPPRPEIPSLYRELQVNLTQLVRISRDTVFWRSALEFDETLPVSRKTSQNRDAYWQVCQGLKRQLETEVKTWLNGSIEDWQKIREALIESLNNYQDFVIKTDNLLLYKLPWHVWDILQERRGIEVTFAPLDYQCTIEVDRTRGRDKPRILAMMGDDTGIDYTRDRAELLQLQTLGLADLRFLEKHQIREFFPSLRESQGWDILVFIGHSTTENIDGRIFIDEHQSISIEQFKNSVREAASNGLQLALFNSCQGLGIARNLVDLQVPAIVVMREPVSDRIAQHFLRAFLRVYREGASLPVAVRRAREQLEDEEFDWPSATWLPTIFRKPSLDLPLWRDFQNSSVDSAVSTEVSAVSAFDESELTPDLRSPPSRRGSRRPSRKQRSINYVVIPLFVSLFVIGIRSLGWLEIWELKAYDLAMQWRIEPMQMQKDDRILIVEINDEDIQYQQEHNMQGNGSLSEEALERLLKYLKQHNATTIGLNIYRDFPAFPEYPELAEAITNTQNLFFICNANISENRAIDPPPEIPISSHRIGTINILRDKDKIVRRQFIEIINPKNSNCLAEYSFSTTLALHYLYKKGVHWKLLPQQHLKVSSVEPLQFNSTTISPLNIPIAAYQDIKNAGAYQIMLNYRRYYRSESLSEVFESLPLQSFLENKVRPELVKNKIVIIGGIQKSFLTPYSNLEKSNEISSVYLQAQMVSQILSAVLDDRPLIKVWPLWLELSWISLWSWVGVVLQIYATFLKKSQLRIIGLAVFGLGIVYAAFFQLSVWIPLVPSVLTLVLTPLLIRLESKWIRQ